MNIRRNTKFTYNVVLWDNQTRKYKGRLFDGSRVKITGHLQRGEIKTADGKLFRYSKVAADHIEFLPVRTV
jgi:single-stranded DNA-binding protein